MLLYLLKTRAERGVEAQNSGTGWDPAGKSSQSWHKDKAPGCAGMALKQDNTLLCQMALGNILEATVEAPFVIYLHVFKFIALHLCFKL